MSVTISTLRDHLVSSLTTLPNPHELGLTVLVSEPKRTSSIFPHTPVPPKCYQQELLVVLSSNVPTTLQPGPSTEAQASQDSSNAEPPTIPSASNNQAAHEKVLASAISAYLYTFPQPSSSSAPSSSILYISKIDSSGYSPTPLPLTRVLIVSFLNYFLVNLEDVRIQLFARAQNQYLFANSSQSGKKKVLSGSGLCKWWKSVYEETVLAYDKSKNPPQLQANTKGVGGQEKEKEDEVKLQFLLPGYDEIESKNLVGQGKESPNNWKWSYKPPFDTPIISASPPSSSSSSSTTVNTKNLLQSLATLIPSLPDDPKTRFLEELVTDQLQQKSNPLSKRQLQPNDESHPAATASTKKTKKERELEEELNDRQNAHLALSKVDPKEFWERIGFRQECGGDVTGFFTLEKKSSIQSNKDNAPHTDNDQVKRVETSSNNESDSLEAENPLSGSTEKITSLDPECAPITTLSISSEEKAIPLPPAPASANPSSTVLNELPPQVLPSNLPTTTTTKKESHKEPLIRQEILNRLLVALTNIDFADLPLSLEGTEIWLKQVKSITIGEIGQKNWENCLATVPPKEGLSEGTGVVRKERQEEQVTMLMPRKKKKVNL